MLIYFPLSEFFLRLFLLGGLESDLDLEGERCRSLFLLRCVTERDLDRSRERDRELLEELERLDRDLLGDLLLLLFLPLLLLLLLLLL